MHGKINKCIICMHNSETEDNVKIAYKVNREKSKV